jgi:hypothetical protein
MLLEKSHELKMLYCKFTRGLNQYSVDLFVFYWFRHHASVFARRLQTLPSVVTCQNIGQNYIKLRNGASLSEGDTGFYPQLRTITRIDGETQVLHGHWH